MKKNSKKNTAPLVDEFADFFSAEPDVNEKAWGLIYDFYHGILTYMEKNDISRSDLAKKLNRSRSAITQMFNKTPNVSLKKMVEIADALNQNLKISFETIGSFVEETDIRPAKASYVPVGAGNVLVDADDSSQFDGINSCSAKVIPFKRGISATIDTGIGYADAANG